jgi:hypothetical protein
MGRLRLFLLSACAANNNVWVKPGAASGEFAQTKYACMQQSQHRVSTPTSMNMVAHPIVALRRTTPFSVRV